MKLLFSVQKEIAVLGIALFVIFFGFNGIQQYVVLAFAEQGVAEIGFQSLILIYAFFIFANPLALPFIGRYGPKAAMLVAATAYSIYMLALASEVVSLLYAASILLGGGAAFFWAGQNSYLLRRSAEGTQGKHVGFSEMLLFLGSGLGTIAAGFLIARIEFQLVFLFAAATPAIGFLLLSRLPHVDAKPGKSPFALFWGAAKSIPILSVASLWFVVQFTFGLAIGVIPVQIERVFGVSIVGPLTASFFLIPILFSFGLGRLSDKIGRKSMTWIVYTLTLSGVFALVFPESAVLLVAGVLILAFGWTMGRLVLQAFAKDLSTGGNLESIIAVFWMVQNAGVVSALVLGRFLSNAQAVYAILIGVTLASFLLMLPLLLRSIEETKRRIASHTQ